MLSKTRYLNAFNYHLISSNQNRAEHYWFTIDNAAIALDDEQKPYGIIRAKSSLGTYLEKNNLISPKEDDPSIVGLFSTDDFILNGNPLSNLDFMVVDYEYPESDGLLGYHFFIKYPMFIDFKKKNYM